MLKDLARLNLNKSPVKVFNGKEWVPIHNIVKSNHKDVYKITFKNS